MPRYGREGGGGWKETSCLSPDAPFHSFNSSFRDGYTYVALVDLIVVRQLCDFTDSASRKLILIFFFRHTIIDMLCYVTPLEAQRKEKERITRLQGTEIWRRQKEENRAKMIKEKREVNTRVNWKSKEIQVVYFLHHFFTFLFTSK